MPPVEECVPPARDRRSAADPRACEDLETGSHDLHRLDDRTESLLRVGALVALDAPQSSYQTAVGAAQRAGADLGELLGVLVASPTPWGPCASSRPPRRIALAADYDVDAALERFDRLRPAVSPTLDPPKGLTRPTSARPRGLRCGW